MHETGRELDDTDRTILTLLAQDARLSVREIARRVGMSPGAIAERIRGLERAGVIVGYQIQIDPAALGFELEAIIGLQTAQGPDLEETLKELLSIEAVESIQIVTGQWDIVARVRVRDHQHLREVIIERMWKMAAFRHSETMIVYETRHNSHLASLGLLVPEGDAQRAPKLTRHVGDAKPLAVASGRRQRESR